MRVVLLNQYYAPDGSSTAQLLADLGGGLAAQGHDVVAVCSDRSYADPRRRYARRETIDGVRVLRARTTGYGRGSVGGRVLDYASFLLGAVGTLLFRTRPDVVVSLSTPPLIAGLGWLLARLRGARAIYWVMDVYPDVAFALGVLRPGSAAGWAFRALSRFVLRRSDRVVALGETMGARLEAFAGRPVDVVHNWADGEAIRPVSLADHALRREWGWSGRFVVLYSGNMGLAHDFATVLDAAALLREREEILFAFVGGGPRRAEVEAEVRRRELSNVEIRPYVERARLGQSLTAPDVHLVTLREEMPGLLVPSKIYGILAAGRPALYVGPDAGEIAEILREGDCGRRVALGDARGLADAVLAYATEPARAERDGRRARELFERRFTSRHGLAAFRRVLDAVAA